jgi:hypothetical protein
MAGLFATTEADIFIGVCHCERSEAISYSGTIDGLIKIFYLIRITKGRRKERIVLRGSILMGYIDRMT